MTTLSPSHGSDTHVRSGNPRKPYAGGTVIRLQADHRIGYIHIPVTDIRGRTVLSATLTGHAHGTFSAQTVTCSAVADSWSAGKTIWDRQPTVGAHVDSALGAHVDGDAVNLDVTTLLQAVANGTKWRGLQLTTDATAVDVSNWYAFDSAKPAWMLTVELSDTIEQPTNLRPNIGAVGSPAPVLAWSFTDLGGDSSEQGGFRVQVDPAADGVTPGYDSGWVPLGDPQFDLSAAGDVGAPDFTDLALHASTQWRVQTRDVAGNESDWSDWATFSYETSPVVVMDSPTGGVIGDSTPDVVAHLTGETLTQWRARVEDTAGNVLWDSALSDGPIEITIPARDRDGRRIIRRDDTSYDVVVRAWGDVDRAVAVGLPAYVETRVTVTFDDDAGVEVPGNFTATPATPGDPRITFTWTRSEAADALLILNDGEVYGRIDSDDWDVDAGTYTWTDNGLAKPYQTNHFTVRAIESGVRSVASGSVTYTSRPEGVWLVPVDDDPVVLDGTVVAFTQNDRRTVFKPPTSPYDIDVVTALEGISGSFTGSMSEDPDRDVLHAVKILNRIRANIYASPQLVWATQSIPVTVRDMSPLPDGDAFNADTLAHAVAFSFSQAGD